MLEEAMAGRSPEAAAPFLLASGRIVRDWERRVIALAANDAEGYRRAAPPLRRFAEDHPDWFVYNEVGDRWIYNGWHFQQIMTADPRGMYADNAAWEMTTLSRRGECEGDPVCDIVRGAGPYQEFLEHYPRSIFSPQAVAAMAPHLQRVASLSPEARATPELEDLIARFRGISVRLEGPAQRQAESLLTGLEQRGARTNGGRGLEPARTAGVDARAPIAAPRP